MGNRHATLNRPEAQLQLNPYVLSIHNSEIDYIHPQHPPTDQLMQVTLKTGTVINDVAIILPISEAQEPAGTPVCSICLDHAMKCAIVDCGHATFCVSCIRNWVVRGHRGCPICARRITRVIRLF